MGALTDRLGAGKYLLLTTYRRDGSPVPTPVWVVRDGDALAVWTVTTSGTVKRIRRNGEVMLAECDMRGRPLGDAVPGTAKLLDADGTQRVRVLLRRKYGMAGWLGTLGSRIRRGRDGTIGIAIVPR